jgi:FkbM family methyltransferase
MSAYQYPLDWLRRWRFRRRIKKRTEYYDDFFENVNGGSIAIGVPEFQGIFHLDPRSDTLKRLMIYKKYEPRLVALIEKHLDQNRDALDIGANIGLFSVLMGRKLSIDRRVLAVEPTPAALHYLNKNIIENGLSEKVILFKGVLAEAPGKYDLDVIPGMEEYSSIGEIVHPDVDGKSSAKITVQGETVDHLVSRWGLNPGFIKVDVEGSELQVLKGAKDTIQKHLPVILSELNDLLLGNFNASSSMVADYLQGYGYHVRDVHHPGKVIETPFIGEIIALPRKLAL